MGNLVKIAPEHVRPVSALEHELIPTPRHPRAPETSNPPQTLQDPAGPNSMGQETNTSQENIERPQSNASEEQPDTNTSQESIRRAEILVDDQDIEQWKQTNKEPRFCVRCQFFQT